MYQETLCFIAKCLTIALEERNRLEIEKQLKSNSIDWNAVVKVSTAHYVLPALYCILKRTDFLKYLPSELLSYMENITDLNRRRNKQIITQAQEINRLLLDNNLTPIFLKGTGNLLAGIYVDIAERMVGDIDFIFSKEDYPKAIIVLKKNGYYNVEECNYYNPAERHFRRLKNDNNIASIEIHHNLLVEKYANEFNYEMVQKDSQIINGVTVLSFANKLNLSIIANQINDSGYYYKAIPLRNAYDVFLLSKKTNAKNAVNALIKLTNPLNCFLATCYEVFDKVSSLEYLKTKKTASYLKVFKNQLRDVEKTKRKHNRIKIYLIIKSRFILLYKSVLYKEYRFYLFMRAIDKSGYKEKLIKFGIKL